MSVWAYGAGAAGLFLVGQQAGMDLLDQALNQDVSVQGVMNTASQLAGLGVSATDAAIIVAGAGITYKLLQIATPFADTLNLAWRKKMLGDWQDPQRMPPPPAPSRK